MLSISPLVRTWCRVPPSRTEIRTSSDKIAFKQKGRLFIKGALQLGLYKILCHCQVLVWESIILSLPPPTCNDYTIAILLHSHCAMYAPPPTPPFMPYTIQYW